MINKLSLSYISIYIITCFLTCFIIYYLTIIIIFKIKSRFWYIQPCYHFYDLHYIFYNNKVIHPELPKINSFVSFEKVITYTPDDIQKEQFDSIIELLKREYYHTKNAVYNPTIQSVLPYLTNNYYNSFISLAVTPTYKFVGKSDSNTNHIIKYNDIIGCIMSKAICITIPTGEFYSYYVDFFCIKSEFRKLGYSEIMIQSHEYSNRMKTRDIQVHLFKREGNITGIVPVVKYDTYLYDLTHYFDLITPSSFLYNIKNIYHSQSPILLQITKLNIQLIYDYLSEIKNNHIFQFIATVHISNFKELIETKNIYCFVLMYKQKIYASYFLKNTFMEIEKGGGDLGQHTTISCFASIKDNDYDTIMDYSFCQTFYQIIQIIRQEGLIFSYLFIENISHNHLLIKDCTYISKTKTAYFLYNYILQPLKQKNVFIIT
jgi:hypothetical protein